MRTGIGESVCVRREREEAFAFVGTLLVASQCNSVVQVEAIVFADWPPQLRANTCVTSTALRERAVLDVYLWLKYRLKKDLDFADLS